MSRVTAGAPQMTASTARRYTVRLVKSSDVNWGAWADAAAWAQEVDANGNASSNWPAASAPTARGNNADIRFASRRLQTGLACPTSWQTNRAAFRAARSVTSRAIARARSLSE